MWFDQGHTLLHSFWYYEAERAFRWASKLDPDAPMPYWGLVRSVGGGARARAFMKEAIKRKAKRERARARLHRRVGDSQSRSTRAPRHGRADRRKFVKALESIVMKYPDDIEAKAILGNEMMGETRVGTELLMQQVLAADPKHPGAHHYRIHNWDDEDGALALDSCRAYGDIAPGIGHALHMPGSHLRRRRHVPRVGDLARLGHARRDRLHGTPDGVPVQHVELRAQPQLSELRAGAARHADRSAFAARASCWRCRSIPS